MLTKPDSGKRGGLLVFAEHPGPSMKLVSLDYLVQNAKATLFRFPWVLTVACAATAAGIWFTEVDHNDADQERVGHLAMALFLGISLCFGLSILLERIRLPRRFEALVFLPVLSLLGLYAYAMKDQSEFLVAARFALFLLASHLFVAAAPYLRRSYNRGFWEYNHRLFHRIIESGMFSGCLFLGLAAALAAVDHLFDITVSEKVYPRLFLVVAGIFNTWFFLAGVPGDLEELERDHPYPRMIKVLTQYILVPLVSLYLVILYAYALKIVVEWEWPVGWVSYLVLICSLLGIFSLLLVHPIQEMRENRWIKVFSRYFFIVLFPLLILLFAAIGRRISEYRLTENRYFVLVMAAWLSGIALYFSFSRSRNIKVVPITLGILALLTSFGPWGAFQVARHSQVGRLQDLLQSQGLLKDGKVVPAADSVAKETEAQIGSVVEFLEERKLLKTLRAWLPDSAAADADSLLKNRHVFLKQMGLKFVRMDRNGKIQENQSRYLSANPWEPLPITGFDYVLAGEQRGSRDTSFTAVLGPDSCEVHILADSAKVRMTAKGIALMDFKLWPLLDSLHEANPGTWENKISPKKLYREFESGGYKVGLLVHYVYAEAQMKKMHSLKATIFVKVPPTTSP